MLVDADGDQYGNVAYFAAPGALQDDAVQVDIGMLTFDGTVAPFLDFDIDLLVKIADSAGAYLGSPQGFGIVFDASD